MDDLATSPPLGGNRAGPRRRAGASCGFLVETHAPFHVSLAESLQTNELNFIRRLSCAQAGALTSLSVLNVLWVSYESDRSCLPAPRAHDHGSWRWAPSAVGASGVY